MPTEQEYINYKDFVESLDEATPSAGDKAVFNDANGPKGSLYSAIANFVLGLWAAFIHGLTAVTSFVSGDEFPLVNGSTGKRMSKDALLQLTAQNALAGNVAQEFVPSSEPNPTTTVAGQPYVYNGSLYVAKVDGYQGPWDSSKFIVADVGTYIKALNDKVVLLKSFKDSFAHGRITTNGDVGTVVDLTVTETTSWFYSVKDCFDYEVFKIKGGGGNTSRLWCFVDENNRIISRAVADLVPSEPIELIAPRGAKKLIVNSYDSAFDSGIFECESNVASEFKTIENDLDLVEKLVDRNTALKSFKEDFVVGNIQTNGAVGSVVDLTVNTSQTGWRCYVGNCEVGDKFALKGDGGTSPRLWCFVDKDNKIISNAVAELHPAEPIELTAPTGAKKIIVNVNATSYSDSSSVFKISCYSQEILDELNELKLESEKNQTLVSFKDSFARGRIADNGAVGSVVDLTVIETSSWFYSVRDCFDYEAFKIKGGGGDGSRLWCFIDKDNKLLSKSVSNLYPSTPIELIAPKGAKKLIVNCADISFDEGVFEESGFLGDVYKQVKDNTARLDSIQSFKPSYEFSLAPQDFADEISGVDFTPTKSLEVVYDKFDQLVVDFPDLVTKSDAAVVADIAYPSYANGVGPDDPDYLETPAYKMFMYKISNTNVGAGNTTRFKKKTLFLIAGQHGSETAAQFNAYLFAKKLCNATEQAAFNILAYFDVYIIPCVNGYGIYHNTRVNANLVDLNRNYPTPGWYEEGSGTTHYTGPSAGSEFETQVVMAIAANINPNMFVDHHNYEVMECQFYTECDADQAQALIYKSLVNLSEHFTRLFPEYFGSKYHLFQGVDANWSPKAPTSINGGGRTYFYATYHIPSFIIEICKHINYIDGEYDPAESFTNDCWKVGYMTLCEQVMRYSLLCFEHFS